MHRGVSKNNERFCWPSFCAFNLALWLLLGTGACFAANTQSWAVAIGGGGGIEETSIADRELLRRFHESMAPRFFLENRRLEFFGADERHCATGPSEEWVGALERARSAFEHAKATDCAAAEQMLDVLWSGADLAPSCHRIERPDSIVRVRNARLASVREGLARLTSQVRRGERLFFLLAGPSDRHQSQWRFGLGARFQRLELAELRKAFERLENKGVIIHLSALTSYAGALEGVLGSRKHQADGCMVAATARDAPRLEAHPLARESFELAYARWFGELGSQFGAWACARLVDARLKPRTSLDEIIERGKSGGWLAAAPGRAISAGAFGGALDQKRRKLLRSVEAEWQAAIGQCALHARATQRLLDRLQDCLQAGQLQDEKEALAIEAIKALRVTHHSAEIERHRRFLHQADARSIEEYRQAFCCLSHDFHGRRPAAEVCR